MHLQVATAVLVTSLFLQSLVASIAWGTQTQPQPQYQAPPVPSQAISPVSVQSVSPADLLKSAVEIAQNGDTLGAFEKAKEAKQLSLRSGQFYSSIGVDYLNALISISSAGEDDQTAGIVQEAVSTVDTLKQNSEFNGLGNPQTGYFFMVSVGKLAPMLESQKAIFVKLLSDQGNIASNLRNNPGYPLDGQKFLADPMVGAGLALAIENKVEEAKAKISAGCALGFCEFEKLSKNPALAHVVEKAAIITHIEAEQRKYVDNLKTWSVQEIQKFQPFRFTFHIDSLRGGTVSSNDFDNNILVVDFWATWCPPCRDGLPHFQQLANDFRDRDVKVLGISMDSPEDPISAIETVKTFLSEKELTFMCAMGTQEVKNQLPANAKWPMTLFIDRSGTVRYMAVGYHDYSKVAAITEALLNEKQPVKTSSGLPVQ